MADAGTVTLSIAGFSAFIRATVSALSRSESSPWTTSEGMPFERAEGGPQVEAGLAARQLERLGDAHVIVEHDAARSGSSLAQPLGVDQPLVELPVGIAVALRLGEEAGGVEPGRPVLRAADIGADMLEPARLDHRADIVEQGAGDPLLAASPPAAW